MMMVALYLLRLLGHDGFLLLCLFELLLLLHLLAHAGRVGVERVVNLHFVKGVARRLSLAGPSRGNRIEGKDVDFFGGERA